jgi:hypothetical protein
MVIYQMNLTNLKKQKLCNKFNLLNSILIYIQKNNSNKGTLAM